MNKLEFEIIMEELGLLKYSSEIMINNKNVYMWNGVLLKFDNNKVYVSGHLPFSVYKIISTNFNYYGEYILAQSLPIDDKETFLKLLLAIKEFNCVYENQVLDYDAMIGNINLAMLRKTGCTKSMYDCIGMNKEMFETVMKNKDFGELRYDIRELINKFMVSVNPFCINDINSQNLSDYSIEVDQKDNSYYTKIKNRNNNNSVSFSNSKVCLSYQVRYMVEPEKVISLSYNIDMENYREYFYICCYKNDILVDEINYCLTNNKIGDEDLNPSFIYYLSIELKNAIDCAKNVTDIKTSNKQLIKK